ncbi:MAG: BTAD domain-containing putative transcriptional regulator [Candidatus Sericytochromatia bacterium]|nr:BTAD domain-containing putative transcriptional regulator [Candidatus Sericytochromatia bacterium]
MSLPITGRKFLPPALPRHHVPRPALLDRLARGRDPGCRVTVLRAAPGSGKSALLAAFAARGTDAACWYAMDAGDEDPTVFMTHFVACLERGVPGLVPSARLPVDARGSGALVAAVAMLCDDLAMQGDRSVLLILDQVEQVREAPETLRLLETLLRHFPENGQLVLSGRVIPVGFAREQMMGQALLLADRDLAMPAPVIEALLVATGQPSDAERASAIEDATGGWAAGVAWLAATASASLPTLDAADVGALDAYLEEEVLGQLRPEEREVLTRAAVLPRLLPEWVEILLGPDGPQILARAARLLPLGSLVSDQGEGATLFREFLLRRLNRTVPAVAQQALWRAVADGWKHEPELALDALLRAGATQEALSLLLDHLGAWLAEGRFLHVGHVLDRFPAQAASEWAGLAYARGALARELGDLVAACAALEQARVLHGTDVDTLGQRIAAALSAAYGARGMRAPQVTHGRIAMDATEPATRALARNALGLAALQDNAVDEALLHFRIASEAFHLAGHAAGEVRILHNRGLAHARAGDLERAITAYGDAVRCAEAAALVPFAVTWNNMALCLLHLGRREEAWQALERGLALAGQQGAPRERMLLLRTLGQLQLAAGDLRQARESFEGSMTLATGLGDAAALATGHFGLAEVALAEGRVPAARGALAQGLERAQATLLDPSMADAALLAARMALAEADAGQATELLTALLARLEVQPNDLQRFLALNLLVRACTMAGDATGAATAASEARALGVLHGYPMADEAVPPGPEPPPTFELLGFGAFEVRIDGVPLEDREWRSGNAKLVLALLLLNPQGATKERLVDLLYPGTDPARSSLAMVISRLRQALEPDAPKGAQSRFIHFQEGRYLFARGVRSRVDVLDLRALVAEARQHPEGEPIRLQALEQAVAVYRGPFLEDFPDHAWCRLERENLRRLVASAYEELFVAAGQDDDWARLEGLADAALKADGTAQAAIRAKLVALAMQERAGDALRYAEAAARVLETDHGLEADDETTDLVALIAAGRFTVRAARETLALPG